MTHLPPTCTITVYYITTEFDYEKRESRFGACIWRCCVTTVWNPGFEFIKVCMGEKTVIDITAESLIFLQ